MFLFRITNATAAAADGRLAASAVCSRTQNRTCARAVPLSPDVFGVCLCSVLESTLSVLFGPATAHTSVAHEHTYTRIPRTNRMQPIIPPAHLPATVCCGCGCGCCRRRRRRATSVLHYMCSAARIHENYVFALRLKPSASTCTIASTPRNPDHHHRNAWGMVFVVVPFCSPSPSSSTSSLSSLVSHFSTLCNRIQSTIHFYLRHACVFLCVVN